MREGCAGRRRLEGVKACAVKEGDCDRHDQVLLIMLENKTTQRTLLRTVSDVSSDGAFLSSLPHQIYLSTRGSGVNRHDPQPNHGMGIYLLYMTPGECPSIPRSGP